MKKAMYVLAAIAALAAVGFALYWTGLSQGKSQLEAERKAFNAQIEQMNSRLVASEYGSRLNQARFLLCRALLDLDQRNFGLAANHLKEASAALGNINAAMVGIDPARFASLKKDVAATEISVTTNLDEQRGRVFTFSEQLEALLPPPAPALQTPPANPAPAAPVAGRDAAPQPAAK